MPQVYAQNIPVSLEYSEIYSFIEELATDGILNNVTEAVKPYTRHQVAEFLREAAGEGFFPSHMIQDAGGESFLEQRWAQNRIR